MYSREDLLERRILSQRGLHLNCYQFQQQNNKSSAIIKNQLTLFKVFISCINVYTSLFTFSLQSQVMRKFALISFCALPLLEKGTDYRFGISTFNILS